MSQVNGGKWWNPQAQQTEMGSGTVNAPIFDFNRPKLDTLTRALAPAYLRIGGSESDKAYYDLKTDSAFATMIPPKYQSAMTRQEWDAVNAFAKRTGLQVVFTLNAGPGSRNSDGSWNNANAAELMAYTARQGYPVAVWELGNELNIFWFVHGLGAQVSLDRYAQDLDAARALAKQTTPAAQFAGQGSAFWPLLGEPLSLFYGYMPGYLARSGARVDHVSWHYYPQQSRRGPIASRRAYPSRLLDSRNLDEAGYWADKLKQWRDQYAPGKPIWLGETGNAQFGGEPGLSDAYLGGLWWLDQLGLLARKDHAVVVRQTLSGSDYGMIDDQTLEPRPDYWNSLLWKRLMGTRVYATQTSDEPSGKLRIYAHATANDEANSVTVLAINLDDRRDAIVSFPQFGSRARRIYTLNAPDLFGGTIQLNDRELKLVNDQTLPELKGIEHDPASPPAITLHPLSYAFIVFPLR
jgi:heparanase 1